MFEGLSVDGSPFFFWWGRRAVKLRAEGSHVFFQDAGCEHRDFLNVPAGGPAVDANGIYAASLPQYAFLRRPVGELLELERNIKKIPMFSARYPEKTHDSPLPGALQPPWRV